MYCSVYKRENVHLAFELMPERNIHLKKPKCGTVPNLTRNVDLQVPPNLSKQLNTLMLNILNNKNKKFPTTYGK